MTWGDTTIRENIDQTELQALLMERAERLHEFVDRRIPITLRATVSADDILQEAWLAAFRNIETFTRDGPDAFDRWLARITERKLIDALRSAGRARRRGPPACSTRASQPRSSYVDLFSLVVAQQRSPSSEGRAREITHAVRVALSMLPEDVRRAVVLCHIEGKSRAEIARAMDRTRPAVNTLLFRGMKLLRGRLELSEKFFSDDERQNENGRE